MGKFSEEPGYREGGRSSIMVRMLQNLFAAGVVDSFFRTEGGEFVGDRLEVGFSLS